MQSCLHSGTTTSNSRSKRKHKQETPSWSFNLSRIGKLTKRVAFASTGFIPFQLLAEGSVAFSGCWAARLGRGNSLWSGFTLESTRLHLTLHASLQDHFEPCIKPMRTIRGQSHVAYGKHLVNRLTYTSHDVTPCAMPSRKKPDKGPIDFETASESLQLLLAKHPPRTESLHAPCKRCLSMAAFCCFCTNRSDAGTNVAETLSCLGGG